MHNHKTNAISQTRATWRLAWPIAIGQIATTGMSFIDTIMSGHVSTTDLAAVSVGSSIWVTIIVTMLGYLLATSPMVAQKVGANDRATIPSLVQQALVQALVLALITWIFARLISPIFMHLGLEDEVTHKAADFLKAITWGLPAFACYRVLYGYSAALNLTKPMMVISIFCLLLNIPVNWILIYGHFGFPALGGVGCGWATAFCVWVNFILLALWIIRTKAYGDTHPFKKWQGMDWQVQAQFFKIGLPIGIMLLVEVSAFSLIALIIAKLGTTSVAAHQIALNFTSLTFMVPMAVGTALTVRVGHAVGAKNFKKAREIGHNGSLFGLGIALTSGILMMFCSNWIAAWYSTDVAVIHLAAQIIVLAGFFQFSDITQVVSAGILRGYKVTRVPMMIHMTAFWAIGMPLGYALTFGYQFLGMQIPALGIRGYWIALIIALTFTAVSLQYLFRKISRRELLNHVPSHIENGAH